MISRIKFKNKTETIGFLLIITKIPEKIDASETKVNKE